MTNEEENLLARVATDFAERERAGEKILEEEYFAKLPTEELRASARLHVQWSGVLTAIEQAKRSAGIK